MIPITHPFGFAQGTLFLQRARKGSGSGFFLGLALIYF
jgi:hypothetical protein